MNALEGRPGHAFRAIASIDGVGEVTAEALIEFFSEPHNQDMLSALLNEVTIEDFEQVGGDSDVAG